jgi:two-component system response regulator YesN
MCLWENINYYFLRLIAVLEQNKILDDAIIFLEDISSENLPFPDDENDDITQILGLLEESLNEGDNEKLKENLEKIVQHMVKDRESFILLRFEVSSIFVKYMKKIGLHKITYDDICSKLIDMNGYPLEYNRLLKEYLEILNSFTHLLAKNTHNTKGVIDTVLTYIDENISGDLSLTTVSSTVFHSPTYLSKLFKRSMGVGFCKYVANQRMKLACGMVLKSDKKINEIASLVGFESVSYFIKTFKKTYNLSPQEYRNKYVS